MKNLAGDVQSRIWNVASPHGDKAFSGVMENSITVAVGTSRGLGKVVCFHPDISDIHAASGMLGVLS